MLIFIRASKFSLKEGNNEISFVVHKKLKKLRKLPQYEKLLNFGFKEEECLGNKQFVTDYIDQEKRI